MRVVLADDAQDIRFLVRALLSVDESVEIVAEAASPEEVVRFVADLQPDVLILDQGFEGPVSGTDIAPTLKQSSPGTKIVLFTAYHGVSEMVEMMPSIDAFLLKTDAHELLQLVTSLGTA